MIDHSHHDDEGGFYKGLVFGAILGVGTFLLLNSEKGKKFVKTSKTRIDKILNEEPIMSEYEDEVVTEEENGQELPKAAPAPRRFFKKSK